MYENNVHYCLWMLVQSLDARRKIASSASILRYLAPSFEGRTFCVETLLRVFLARRTRVANILMSTPRMVEKASDCGRLGRQAAGHPWSALRVVKSCRKDCPTASVLPKPK